MRLIHFKVSLEIRPPVAGPVTGLGGEKHEIYVTVYGGHLFYDLFLQGRGWGHGSLGPLWIRYCEDQRVCNN